MEGCLLCLQTRMEFMDFIKVNSTQWQDLNIHNIIEKHLWPIKNLQSSSWICTICWQELHDFHTFFMTIKAAHKRFETAIETDRVDPDNLTDRKPTITEFQYEIEMLQEQILPESTQQNLKEKTIPNAWEIEKLAVSVKLEQEPGTKGNTHIDLTNNNKTNTIEREVFGNQNFVIPNENLGALTNTETLKEQDSLYLSDSTTVIKKEHDDMLVLAKDIRGSPLPNKSTYETIKNTSQSTPSNESPRQFSKNERSTESLIASHMSLKPKGKRGRPRKTDKIVNTEIPCYQMVATENLSFPISTQQDEQEYEDEISLEPRKPGRPAKNTNKYRLTLQQKNKIRANRIISRPARKRRLPHKYLTYEIESTEGIVIKNTQLYSFLKSGKRGRPRKILLNTLASSNTSKEQTSPTELLDENWDYQDLSYKMSTKSTRKRGRPRKYFTNIEMQTEKHEENGSRPIRKRILPSKFITYDVESKERYILNNSNEDLFAYNKGFKSTGKRGRPRKIFANAIQNSKILKKVLKSKGKRGRPCKSLTNAIQNSKFSSEFEKQNSIINMVQQQEDCDNMPSTSTGKRELPEECLTNATENMDIFQEETVASNNTMLTSENNAQVVSKLQNRKGVRPYKDVMRNYIATSVRCMQLFKTKNKSQSNIEKS